jgi:hypothetical protein
MTVDIDMTDPVVHLRDDQLLLYASGELRDASAGLASAHMRSCPRCKSRLNELESALGEFAQAHRIACDPELPSAAGPRALLKAQLSDLSSRAPSMRQHSNGAWSAAVNWRSGMAAAALALILILVGRRVWRGAETDPSQIASLSSSLSSSVLPEEPDARFTPGAVVSATRDQVCSDRVEMSAAVPAAIKNRVLQLYGVGSGQSDAYEVDYLITPGLGGATDIRNLWPEPYDHTVWNAHVKDRLEDRLRELVCHGDLDLATAQRDISTDWIAAYRKYFHADVPVLAGSS